MKRFGHCSLRRVAVAHVDPEMLILADEFRRKQLPSLQAYGFARRSTSWTDGQW